jgi:aspartate/glutamate racemase
MPGFDKDARRKYKREWARKHADRKRSHVIATRYGLTAEQYEGMFTKQAGTCAICFRHQSQFKKRLCVDHDHRTNAVRGLLCTECNLLLGYAKDSLERLDAAKQYLEAGVGAAL